MTTLVKWTAIILLLVASALMPLLVARNQIGAAGSAIWVALIVYAYAPAMVAKDRPVWFWTVVALCVLAVAAFAIGLVKEIVTPEFELWVSFAGWANLLSWALAIGSRLAGRYGRMDLSGFGPSPPLSGRHLDAA